ncbi:MAG: imidazole glycerol phosphate synthase subunit HisH [Deltaproteobacteria bacterium]|nr:imidazole glycerol phosphate synthase subunit HisH [Deltaproteobacteria bacterium]
MKMIVIIDYDMGNLRSVQKGFERVGHDAVITRDPKDIANASHIVLPGVGAFKECMDNLINYGLVEPILKAIESGKPFLGICLGLQLLFTESEEFGTHKGLDIIKGKVKRFQVSSLKSQEMRPATCDLQLVTLKIPHMGWNDIRFTDNGSRFAVFKDIPDGSYFYFVHSYYVVPEGEGVIATTTNYGIDFTSSIWKDNIFACQFHPEKSQKVGLGVLKNFGDMKW